MDPSQFSGIVIISYRIDNKVSGGGGYDLPKNKGL